MNADVNHSTSKIQHSKFPKGRLYLIPCGLGGENESEILPSQTIEIAASLNEFIVEKEKTARHFLKRIGIKTPLPEVSLHPLNKHTSPEEFNSYLNSCDSGKDIGLISEAGCPGVADPGAEIVKMAHEKGIEVVPLVGPSSILLALMASGMNGQSFVFHGYLPKDSGKRNQFIRQMENDAHRKLQTQVFMETPFRNNQLVDELLKKLSPKTRLGIACNLTVKGGWVKTKPIDQWRKQKPVLQKKPTILMLF